MALLTEYHCHILPGIDDGASDADTALEMIRIMKSQGVERICATPHFYAHREKTVADYLVKRQAAFDSIKDRAAISDIHLGAEVTIEHGISELPDIEKLAIEGTRIILLEFPYRPYEKWMSEEIYNIAAEYNLKVMLAHVHRYIPYYNRDEMNRILNCNAIYQINNEAFTSWFEKKIAKRVIAEHTHFVFGSDSHNTSSRKPNWDMLQKRVKREHLDVSSSMFEKYSV